MCVCVCVFRPENPLIELRRFAREKERENFSGYIHRKEEVKARGGGMGGGYFSLFFLL